MDGLRARLNIVAYLVFTVLRRPDYGGCCSIGKQVTGKFSIKHISERSIIKPFWSCGCSKATDLLNYVCQTFLGNKTYSFMVYDMMIKWQLWCRFLNLHFASDYLITPWTAYLVSIPSPVLALVSAIHLKSPYVTSELCEGLPTNINPKGNCFLESLLASFISVCMWCSAQPITTQEHCKFSSKMGHFTDINSSQVITTASNSSTLSSVLLHQAHQIREGVEFKINLHLGICLLGVIACWWSAGWRQWLGVT